MKTPKVNPFKITMTSLALALIAFSTALAAFSQGVDVKVTNDNNNVDGGTPNPGFDAQNRQQNETTIAISPADPAIVASGANDDRMVPITWHAPPGAPPSGSSGRASRARAPASDSEGIEGLE